MMKNLGATEKEILGSASKMLQGGRCGTVTGRTEGRGTKQEVKEERLTEMFRGSKNCFLS
jgi:hypothetical protein